MQQYEQLKTRLDKLEKNEHVKRRVNAEAAETNASGMETTAASNLETASKAVKLKQKELDEAKNKVESLKAQVVSAKKALLENTDRKQMERNRDEAKLKYDAAAVKANQTAAASTTAEQTRLQCEKDVSAKTKRAAELATQLETLNTTSNLRKEKLTQVKETEKEEKETADSLEGKYKSSSTRLAETRKKHIEVEAAFAKRKGEHETLTQLWTSATEAYKVANEEFAVVHQQVEALNKEYRQVKDHLDTQKAKAEPRSFQAGGKRRKANKGPSSPRRGASSPGSQRPASVSCNANI